MEQQYDIEQLIIKEFTGEASAREIMLISNWLSENPENELLYMQMKEYWNAEVSSTAGINHNKVLEQLLSSIQNPQAKPHQQRRLLWYVATAAAACIAFLLFWNFQKDTIQTNTYSYFSGDAIAHVDLPDGTQIVLNKHTRLTYNDSYGKDIRDVQLEGEAYFQVVKNPQKPFKVKMDETQITVLGTTFSARYRQGEAQTTAALIEGSIRFESPDQEFILNPNQLLVYTKTDRRINVNDTDTETLLAWKDNLIRYKSLPFAEAVKALETQYNVSIETSDKQFSNELVTGAFDKNLGIEQVLDMIKENIHFKWKKTGEKRYLIYK